MSLDQAGALQAGDDAAHGWRADLFGVGEFAERSGPTEDEHGESGELGRTDAAFAVADAKTAKQVNRSGVELIRDVRRRG